MLKQIFLVLIAFLFSLTFVSAEYGSAIYFDGSNDNVNTTNSTFINGSNEFSISTWIKITGQKDYGGIVMTRGSTGINGLYMNNANNKVRFSVNTGGTDKLVTSLQTLDIDTWYHIVGTWTTGTAPKIYINGTLDNTGGTATAGSVFQDDIIRFGWEDGVGTRRLNGTIDEITIWNRSLSASEITSLYNSGVGTYVKNTTAPYNVDLRAIWHLDEGTGLIAVDSYDNNNGTLVGGSTWVQGWIQIPPSPSLVRSIFPNIIRDFPYVQLNKTLDFV